jgi:two-component system, response regulator YesN
MLQDMHESFGNVFGNEALVWEKLLKLDTIFDLQLWLRNIFSAVIDYLTERKCGSNKKIITDILKYIDANYHKNISITDISQEVYLSPNYISIIFKKETGEAFTNFLIRYRMEKAVQMLKDTNLKVYEIGDRVGYSNTSHFCTAFKKLFGVSPNEYRDKI